MTDLYGSSAIKLLTPSLFLAGLIWLCYSILQPFLDSVAWAVIIAYIMWPAYRWLRYKLNNNATLSAFICTTAISLILMLIFYWIVVLMQRELKVIYPVIMNNLSNPKLQLPDFVIKLPWLNNLFQHYIDRLNTNDAGLRAQALDLARQSLGQLGNFAGNLGKHAFKLGFTLITLFFCFRDGQKAISQLNHGTNFFLGEYQQIYLKTAGDTAHAVVYGLMLAALGQGFIAAVGYGLFGVKAPVLLGAVTALLAIVPFGATLIWLPASFGLMMTGQAWDGIFLFLWGFILISTVDNVIRPVVISGASRIPFLVVMFGVFGGLNAFGGVGLFLGPVILSVALAVWQEWLKQQKNKT